MVTSKRYENEENFMIKWLYTLKNLNKILLKIWCLDKIYIFQIKIKKEIQNALICIRTLSDISEKKLCSKRKYAINCSNFKATKSMLQIKNQNALITFDGHSKKKSIIQNKIHNRIDY